MERFALSERQAQAILDLRLARLAKLEVKKLEEELEQLKKLIEKLRAIIDDTHKQWDIVKSEMREIKRKYKCERKTRIVEDESKIAVKRADAGSSVSEWAVGINANDNLKFMERGEFKFIIKKKLPASASLSQLHKQVLNCGADDVVYATA